MPKPRTKSKTLAEKIEHNAAAIKRWERRATRAISTLARLTKQRSRLQRLAALPAGRWLVEPAPALPAPSPAVDLPQAAIDAAVVAALPASVADDFDGKRDMPGFLRRSERDQADIAAAKAERDDRGKRKRQGQEATRKARRSGATRAMPLTGKAALAAIRETP